MDIWSFHGGTTHTTSLSLPPHLAFPQEESVHAYAEKVARRWVDYLRAGSKPSASPQAPAAHGAEGQRDRTTGCVVLNPTTWGRTRQRRKKLSQLGKVIPYAFALPPRRMG